MDKAFSAYFAALSPGPKRVALALRQAIERAGPELTTRLWYGHPSWHGQRWVLSVVGHRAHCNLQLAQGAELVDDFPERIEGSGKALRHVKVRSEDEVDGEIEDIIAAAIALGERGTAGAPRSKR